MTLDFRNNKHVYKLFSSILEADSNIACLYYIVLPDNNSPVLIPKKSHSNCNPWHQLKVYFGVLLHSTVHTNLAVKQRHCITRTLVAMRAPKSNLSTFTKRTLTGDSDLLRHLYTLTIYYMTHTSNNYRSDLVIDM